MYLKSLPFQMLLILLVILGAACNSSSSDDDETADGDSETAPEGEEDWDVSEIDGDFEEEDGDIDTADGDIESSDNVEDGDSEEQEWQPYWPPETDSPMLDTAFLQEFNHTVNELEVGIGGLVSVLIPPDSLKENFETPTQITPRGLVMHDDSNNPYILSIDELDADLIAAAFCDKGLMLAGPDKVYMLAEGAEEYTVSVIPQEISSGITGLSSGAERVYIHTLKGLTVGDFESEIDWPDLGIDLPGLSEEITTVYEYGEKVYIATIDKVYAVDYFNLLLSTMQFGIEDGLNVNPIVAIVPDLKLPQDIDLVIIGENGIQAVKSSSELLNVPEFAAGKIPLDAPTCAERTSDGGFIVGTAGGAYRIMDRGAGNEWRLYNQIRWLPHENVKAIATIPEETDSPIYFATQEGLAYVTTERMNFEEKSEYFVERILQRHDRDGAVADSHLTTPGDLSTNIPWDSDNDGGWTCYWLMSECFRYLVTGDEEAKAHFDKSLERMLSFRTLTGTDYFLARAVIRKDGCQLDDCDNPDDGEWFTSPDGEWWVKANTSNDEVTSHMFMMGHAYDLCADETQKQQIREHIDGIVGGIIEHGYQLVDLDGECTSYGQFDPEYVNGLAGKYADGGRRAAQMLGAITLAQYMTGDPKYDEAKNYLMTEHQYDEGVMHESEPPFRKGSGDGDELAMQAFFVLLRYETDPALREKWLTGWRGTYSNMKAQQDALWDIVNAVLGGDDPDFVNSKRWFQLYPMDLIRWLQHNHHRKDIVDAPEYYMNQHPERRMRSDGNIIPPDERPNTRHNTCEFEVEGGWGANTEMDGADAIMPYWMGRYYGFISMPQD